MSKHHRNNGEFINESESLDPHERAGTEGMAVKTGVKVDRKNPTALLIAEEIREHGKIPYSRFMELSLFSPDGYYAAGKVEIGKDKHFLTSPESSKSFGRAMGSASYGVWEAMGRPKIFPIIEMGAGKGALANDLLAWSKDFNVEFYNAVRYIIVEYGHGLIPQQQARIEDSEKVQWVHGSAHELPLKDVEGIFISNELPDAFPVEIVTRPDKNEGIKQKFVSIKDDEWVEILGEPTEEVRTYVNDHGLNIQEAEEPVNLAAVKWQKQVDAALRRGVIITIDYGQKGQVGTQQGAIRHYPADESSDPHTYAWIPYTSPGNMDLTASINFAILEKIALEDGLSVKFSGSQRQFLRFILQIKNKSWAAVAKLSEIQSDLVRDESLRDPSVFGDYYALMTMKGVDIICEPTLIPIDLGVPKQNFWFNNDPRSNFNGKCITTDGTGRVFLPLNKVTQGFIIFPYENGRPVVDNPVLDLSDPKQLMKFANKLGYDE